MMPQLKLVALDTLSLLNKKFLPGFLSLGLASSGNFKGRGGSWRGRLGPLFSRDPGMTMPPQESNSAKEFTVEFMTVG